MSAVARLVAFALVLVASAAVAQNVQQIFLTESRAFLEQHWKKLAAWDPAAFADFAPEGLRNYVGYTGRGADRRIGLVGSASGPDLKRRLERQLAAEKEAKEAYDFKDLRLMNFGGLTVRYCATRSLASQPAAEEYCWLIESRGGAGYAILEDQVPGRFFVTTRR